MIHDQSATGSTLFIEPAAVVKYNNELAELGIKEQNEIEKILSSLSLLLSEDLDSIKTNLNIMTELDFIFAKGQLAKQMRGSMPIFDNTKSIKTTSDLMQISGTLIYPAGNFTGYNAFLDSDFTQPDYSTGLTTGTRTWYRKFYASGSKMGATLTFEATKTISSSAFGDTLTVRIGKPDADGTIKEWYDATKKNSANNPLGILASIADNKLDVTWDIFGAAQNGIIVELGMAAAKHIIKKLTVAFK
jgi:hypothetical protein